MSPAHRVGNIAASGLGNLTRKVQNAQSWKISSRALGNTPTLGFLTWVSNLDLFRSSYEFLCMFEFAEESSGVTIMM